MQKLIILASLTFLAFSFQFTKDTGNFTAQTTADDTPVAGAYLNIISYTTSSNQTVLTLYGMVNAFGTATQVAVNITSGTFNYTLQNAQYFPTGNTYNLTQVNASNSSQPLAAPASLLIQTYANGISVTYLNESNLNYEGWFFNQTSFALSSFESKYSNDSTTTCGCSYSTVEFSNVANGTVDLTYTGPSSGCTQNYTNYTWTCSYSSDASGAAMGYIDCNNVNITNTTTTDLEYMYALLGDGSLYLTPSVLDVPVDCFNQYTNGGSSSMLWIILGVIGGILLLIVIAGVIVMVLKGKKGSDEDTEGNHAKLVNN